MASEMMNRILHETNAVGFKCFLTGSDNFRYSIYPDYKANRRDMPRPKHLQCVREHLVSVWNASVTDNIEADDAMGIEQCLSNDNSTMICTIDKDLLQIPGQHYNFVKQEFRTVSPLEGLRHFYWQLVMGDRSDNILGYDGKMRQKVPNFLQPTMDLLQQCMSEWEMFQVVRDMYKLSMEEMLMYGRCLYIWQKENDEWNIPVGPKEVLDGSQA
jgi:5'-3' exonuclease